MTLQISIFNSDCSKTLDEAAADHVPAVYQYEEDEFEGE